MIEDMYYYDNKLCANELDCVWTALLGAHRRMLIARTQHAGARVADCYVTEGADADAAMQVFKDILILRGRWHGAA